MDVSQLRLTLSIVHFYLDSNTIITVKRVEKKAQTLANWPVALFQLCESLWMVDVRHLSDGPYSARQTLFDKAEIWFDSKMSPVAKKIVQKRAKIIQYISSFAFVPSKMTSAESSSL